jgi:tetratricopeptide (TPR) repeat protein
LTRLRLELLVLFTLICPTQLALADRIADAKRAFLDGKAAFEAGDYPTALKLFERANLIQPAPTLYYNIGMTYERLGRYQDSAIAFDRYLNEAAPPKDEEEHKFREGLRQRAEANRRRPDAAPMAVQPPPVQPQPQRQPMERQPQYGPPTYYSPSPYGIPAPYLRPISTREEQLRQARRHRTNGIVLMAIGVPLSVVGIALTAYGATPHQQSGLEAENYAELFAGITFTLVGVTLWAPGAVSFAKHDRLVRELSRPEPLPPPITAAPPAQALLFSAPALRF